MMISKTSTEPCIRQPVKLLLFQVSFEKFVHIMQWCFVYTGSTFLTTPSVGLQHFAGKAFTLFHSHEMVGMTSSKQAMTMSEIIIKHNHRSFKLING